VLLGIDIGTTHTKGVVIDASGNILGEATRECQLYSDHPNWAEMEPGQWWSNTQEITRELVALAEKCRATIAAVGVSGMVPALVLLDNFGQPLRRSIQQNDARTVVEIEELKAEVDGDEIFCSHRWLHQPANHGPKAALARKART
jgi:xylulokinase